MVLISTPPDVQDLAQPFGVYLRLPRVSSLVRAAYLGRLTYPDREVTHSLYGQRCSVSMTKLVVCIAPRMRLRCPSPVRSSERQMSPARKICFSPLPTSISSSPEATSPI